MSCLRFLHFYLFSAQHTVCRMLIKCPQSILLYLKAAIMGRLKRHIAVVHEKKKPFKCNNCFRSFSIRYHLQMHVKAKHDLKDATGKKSQKGTDFNLVATIQILNLVISRQLPITPSIFCVYRSIFLFSARGDICRLHPNL